MLFGLISMLKNIIEILKFIGWEEKYFLRNVRIEIPYLPPWKPIDIVLQLNNIQHIVVEQVKRDKNFMDFETKLQVNKRAVRNRIEYSIIIDENNFILYRTYDSIEIVFSDFASCTGDETEIFNLLKAFISPEAFSDPLNYFRERINHPNQQIRLETLYRVQIEKRKDLAPYLLNLLSQDSFIEIHDSIILTVGELEISEFSSFLLERVKNVRGSTRAWTIVSLGNIAKKSQSQFIKEEISKVLSEIYNDETDVSIKNTAILSLSECKGVNLAYNTILEGLDDKHVRLNAIGSLGRIGNNSDLKLLEEIVSTSHSRREVEVANESMKSIKTKGSLIASSIYRIKDFISEKGILTDVNNRNNFIKQIFSKEKTITKDTMELLILRRWNSYTPMLPDLNIYTDSIRRGKTKGGGYFLNCTGYGIVIDPGANFIENFLEKEYSIRDIDMIIITHSHIDHTLELETILTLIFESNENVPEFGYQKVKVLLNEGSYQKFGKWLSSLNTISSFQIIKPSETIHINQNLKIIVTKAFHRDLIEEESSIGLKLVFMCENNELSIWITGDTGYKPKLLEGFSEGEIDVLIPHLGSIEYDLLSKSEIFSEFIEDILSNRLDNYFFQNHLGILGILRIIEELKPKSVVITEWGEELRGQRIQLSNLINEIVVFSKIIPGDIGMKILLKSTDTDFNLFVQCSECGKNEEIKDIISHRILEELFEEKIIYLCRNCKTKFSTI